MKSKDVDMDIFKINQLTLDKHWLDQPKLVIKYGLELADAKDRLDRTKSSLDVTKAVAMAQIRLVPKDFGLSEKPTVTALAASVDTHTKVQEIQDKLHKRKHTVEILQAMMNALEHRKRTLEGLVSLHGQQYFAIPQADEVGQEVLKTQTQGSVRNRRGQ